MGQEPTAHGAQATTALWGIEGNGFHKCVLHAVQIVLKSLMACDLFTADLLDGTKV